MRMILVSCLVAGLSLGCGKDKSGESTPAADDKAPAAAEPTSASGAEGPAADQAPAAESGDALGAKVSALYADIGKAVDDHGASCETLAPAALAALQKHMGTLEAMSTTGDTPEAKQWKEDNKELTAEFRTKFAKVQSCARKDPALLEIFTKLGQLRRAAPRP